MSSSNFLLCCCTISQKYTSSFSFCLEVLQYTKCVLASCVKYRLLDPAMESSGSLFVGSYILQLILHLPSEMAQHMQDLTAALVRRMQSSQIAGLKSSLLLVFARLVFFNFPIFYYIELCSQQNVCVYKDVAEGMCRVYHYIHLC